MVYCPNCNRWFKNKQALRAHLKHCPLKNNTKTTESKTKQKTVETKKEEIKTWRFEHMDNFWEITGTETAMDIFKKVDSWLGKQKIWKILHLWALFGALSALHELKLVKSWKSKPIKEKTIT